MQITFENLITATQHGNVELYFDNVRKVHTSTQGMRVVNTGANAEFRVLAPSGYNAIIDLTADASAGNNDNYRIEVGTDQIFKIKGKPSGTYTSYFEVHQDGKIRLPVDNQKLQLGASQDLEIFHDGTNSIIDNDTGRLEISSVGNIIIKPGDKKGIICREDAQVELYFNDFQKLETNNAGVVVTGITSSTGGFSGNATTATDLAINGTNQLLYQASNNDSAILPTGSAGQILQSSGSGAAPQWVTSAPAGAIEGITIREESSIVGSANSISTINFIGQAVTADAAVAAGIATVTINAIPGVLVKEDEANVGTAITAFDFSGSLVDVDAISNTGIATIQIDALSVKDQGSTVGTAGSITTFNFLGDGVTATASGETATVTVSAITGVLVKEDEANVGTAITAFDFSGSLVDVDAVSNTGIATVQIDGLTVKDEGSTVGTAGSITTINFVGAGIAAAVSGDTATVTASGGATQDDIVALAIALG